MLRFLKKHTTPSEKRVPPENPAHRNAGTVVGHPGDPEDINRGGGPQVANQGGRIETLHLPAPNASAPTHGHNDSRDAHDIFHSADDRSRADRATFVLGLAKGSAGALTPLKAVLKSVSAVYAKHQGAAAVSLKSKSDILRGRLTTLEELFEKPPSDEEEIKLREGLLLKLEGIEEKLWSLGGKSVALRYLGSVQGGEDVDGLLGELQDAVNAYMMARQTVIYDQVCNPTNRAEKFPFNNFCHATGAELRHGEREVCLKGTRGAILDDIELWTMNFDEPPIYWLNGRTGTGKSTIARTIAGRLSADDRLGASFFCSRDFEDRRNIRLIFPTLAVQLARKYPISRSILLRSTRSDPNIAYESIHDQMKNLIVQPLKESNISTVIVIDALDECEDEESALAILSVLGRLVSEIPKVKFFLTGRLEPRIPSGLRLPLPAETTDVFVQHEIEPGQADGDIPLFFKTRFSEIAGRRRRLYHWLTEERLNRLCERAAGLFGYAAAMIKFIDNDKRFHRIHLDILMQPQRIDDHEKILDSMYTSILQEAFGDDRSEHDHKARSILAAIVLAVNPVSPSTIATLLGFNNEDVLPFLLSINPLLILQEDASHPAQPFHESFTRFVTDPTRCTNPRFHISPPDHHLELLVGCLNLMSQALKKNMCNLPEAVANSDVGDLKERAEEYLDPALRYACMSWHIHLADVGATPARASTITPILHQFLGTMFLFWLEVLSVLGAVRIAVEALQVLVEWLAESPTLDLANDCFRFVTRYFGIISASSPHIYHSALVLAPEDSIVRELYGTHARPFIRVVCGVPASWDTSVAAVTCPSKIELVVWSPRNRFIAIAQHNIRTIDILDSVTLQRLQTLELPQGVSTENRALVFSPGGHVLTCASRGCSLSTTDPELCISSWDLQIGGPASVIKWQEPPRYVTETSITYSQDGKMVGVLSRYYRGAYHHGTSISIFAVASGVCINSHSLDLRVLPSSGIWTYGGSLRFATIGPTAIVIWEFGYLSAALTRVGTLPIPGGSDHSCIEVRLLPSPCRLALASWGEVLIWGDWNSASLLHHADGKLIPRTSFSPDGRFFACRTTGSEIYLWKQSPTGYLLQKTLSCGPISSNPLISRNGESIITFGDRTIRLWHTKGPTVPLPSSILIRAPHAENFFLDFSPDKTLAAVAMQGDDVITILDLESGAPQLTIDAGMGAYGLRMIKNTVVVIGRWKVVTWNLPPEVRVSDRRVGLEDSSHTVNFGGMWRYGPLIRATINSRYIASIAGQLDHSLYIHNASTGQYIGQGRIGQGVVPWLAPNGSDVWCAGGQGEADVWKINGQGVRLDSPKSSLQANKAGLFLDRPEAGYPWGSSCGYLVTKDWWLLGPDGKRLLMLPSLWRSDAVHRMWKGQFLALLNWGLSGPVILELLYVCDHSGSYQTSLGLLAPDPVIGHPGCRYPKR